MNEEITIQDFLTYEVHSSWWAGYISWSWAQEISGKYFAWKVKRKFARYKHSLIKKEMLKTLTE